MSFQDSHLRQAKGISLAFFAQLRAKGADIERPDEIDVAQLAFLDLSLHVDANRVFQNSIDDLKLLSFLSFRFLDQEISGLTKRRAADLCLKILCAAAKRREKPLPDGHRKYLSSLLYHEVMGKSEVGIGGNGLSAVFHILAKNSEGHSNS